MYSFATIRCEELRVGLPDWQATTLYHIRKIRSNTQKNKTVTWIKDSVLQRFYQRKIPKRLSSCDEEFDDYVQSSFFGQIENAAERTRTSTPLRALGPQPSASANFATAANKSSFEGSDYFPEFKDILHCVKSAVLECQSNLSVSTTRFSIDCTKSIASWRIEIVRVMIGSTSPNCR